MLTLFATMLLAIDGGGEYATSIDYEWPGSSTSMLQMNVDHAAQMTDGGTAIGAVTLRNWDGGLIVDQHGAYFVRGPTNAWANISTSGAGWPDQSAGGKYEVCHTPSWDSTLWRDGQWPNWDGTNYLFDANQVTQHTVAILFGHLEQANLYVRVNGGCGSSGINYLTLDTAGIEQRAGQTYCTSVEWVPVSEGCCNIWVRHNSCGQTPTPFCEASGIVAYDVSGTAPCPAAASYVTLGNRQYGYDTSNLAPTTVHVGAIRVGAK